MTTINIHNLDPDLEKQIREISKEENLSLDQTIKQILSKQLVKPKSNGIAHRFERFVGRMNEDDYQSLVHSLSDMEQTDPGEWV